MAVDLCQCHGGPLSWCPTYRDRKSVVNVHAGIFEDAAVPAADRLRSAGVPSRLLHEPSPQSPPTDYTQLVFPQPGPDDVPHKVTLVGDQSGRREYVCFPDCPGWHDGVVVQADRTGHCGICGETYYPGEQVAKLPLPAYGFPYAHTICEPVPS